MVVVQGGGNHGQSLETPPEPCVQNYLNAYLGHRRRPRQPGPGQRDLRATPRPDPAARLPPAPQPLATGARGRAGPSGAVRYGTGWRAARLEICCALGSARSRRGCWMTATGRRPSRSAPPTRWRTYSSSPGSGSSGWIRGGSAPRCGASSRAAGWCRSATRGANLVPVQATSAAVAAFADRALRQGRRCSSMVGPSAAVSELWGFLRPYWGPARDVRAAQPLMAIDGPPPRAAGPGGQAGPPR